MKWIKIIILTVGFWSSFGQQEAKAQIDTTFWFAAPWVTPDHADNVPMAFLFSTFGNATTIRLRQPASTFDTTFVVAANSLFSKDLSHILNELETKPANTVLTSGFEITSDFPIIVVYDFLSSGNNPETYSLKGQNGLGYEFVCPFQTKWFSQNISGIDPKQQINITATEDNTTIYITPKCDVVGHPAGVTYSVFLPFAGSSYTVENVALNTNVPGNNLAGTIVVSDKQIAVTCSDDSVRSSGGGCYDLMGDQIVPVDVIGTDYVVSKGFLVPAGDESFFAVATENFTTITINDGVTITTQILNQGDTYAHSVTEPLTYISSDKNIYLLHATGYGCEMGEALLPPLNCAGSQQVSFTRNKTQPFFITLTCPAGAEDDFVLNGGLIPINPLDFDPVPGTGGAYVGDTIEFTTGQIAMNSSNLLINTSDFFSMGVFNGGATGGVLYHYLSSFLRRVNVDAGVDTTLCNAETVINLDGSVSGGTTTGIWSVLDGAGTLNSPTNLTTTYVPVQSDYDQGFLTFVLQSTGNCDPKFDTMKVDFIQSPLVSAGLDDIYCKNNVPSIPLTGTLQFAVASTWSGGVGGSISDVSSLNSSYTPSPTDLANDSVAIFIESSGSFFSCPNDKDTVVIYFTDPPSVTAGADIVTCSSNDMVSIAGLVSGASTTGIWSTSGSGAFDPSDSNLSTDYLISSADTSSGSVQLTLTSTNNGNCLAVTDNLTITIVDKPEITITTPDSICANVPLIDLSGTVSSGFSHTWNVDGLGTIANPSSLNTTYDVQPADTIGGTLTIHLSTNGGICPVENDSLVVTFVAPPQVFAGIDQDYCDNEPVSLAGTLSGTASSASWTSTGTGGFNPSNNLLNTFYFPSALDLSNGSVELILTSSTDFGCLADKDTVQISYKPAPVADFSNSSVCLGENTSFTDLSTITTGTINSWQYDFGDMGTSIANNPIHTYNSSGSFDVTLIAGSDNNCYDTITRTIFVNPEPIALFNNNYACENEVIYFNDVSFLASGDIVQWNWDFNNGAGSSNITNPIFTFGSAGQYPVMLEVTSDSGCVSSITNNVDVLAGPTADFTVNPNPGLALEDIVFTDASTGVPISAWFWDYGDEIGGSGQTTVHQYANGGFYDVILTVTDTAGCTDSTKKEVQIALLPVLPTAFTPNGDGENDVFIIRGGPFLATSFQIYNNWGQLVFQTDDANIGWDGTFNGEEAPIGVYTWTFTVVVVGDRTIIKEGDVTLMR
ncbi:MAG: PKD domain-containing protein [Crocinitomicaceae bacterium]